MILCDAIELLMGGIKAPFQYFYLYIHNVFGDLIGDVQQRLCTSSEIKFYSTSLLEVVDDSGAARSSNYLKPNKNCNLSSWIPGCEPGWACSAGKDTKIDFENDKEIPSRTLDCQSCCEGFFCPHGLTCMIRKYLDSGS